MNKVTSISITGVGGQGIILASNIISRLALKAGFDVKKNEIHGMSQRGGSVISEVRFGQKVYSPIVPEGSSDILMSFEKVEALRYIKNLKKDGLVILNNQEIPSSTVLAGSEEYPSGIVEELEKLAGKILLVNAMKDAQEIGNTRTVNIIILGALSNFLPFDLDLWKDIIESSVPKKTVDINIQAFMKGREYR